MSINLINEKKNVLLIGNGNSVYVKNYIEHVLLAYDYKVSIFTDRVHDREFIDYYKNKGVDIITRTRSIPIIKHIPKIRVLEDVIMIKKLIKIIGRFHIVHVHYVNRLNTILIPVLRKHSDHIVVTYWGSDFLRKSTQKIRSLKRYLALADTITFNNNDLIGKFNHIFKDAFIKKTTKAKFGSDIFNTIAVNQETEDINKCKDSINIPKDKYIIVIGHNRNKNHHQLEILKQIASTDKKYLKKICIIFPMTYGNKDADYEDQLQATGKDLVCDVIFFYDFMSSEDTARLRRVADIFIHAQSTDAFSATVQEFLYSGAIVFNGSWLKYDELKNNDVEYFEFEYMENIPKLLMSTIKNIDTIKKRMKLNQERIYKISSWEVNADKWIDLYGKKK
ncbi:MAG: glycosyltransferase [Candidatus Marinimicrobia bacterium]|nr:glycosyltransferase [Candidatus Neomarinimicrobiota bacterium]